ncbi:MAG: hypothetical protein P4M09_24945 [Devosia sp.]|nr:hypothetical protein [Devosia sp.]
MAQESAALNLMPALLIAAVALLGGMVADYAPPKVGQMAVVFPLGTGEGRALAAIIAAGGRYVGPSRFGNITIAFALDPDFADRIHAAGAWLTLAAQGLCSPTPPQPRTI